MSLSWNEIKSRAIAFSKEWEHEIYESGEAKSFLDEFFNVFGVNRRRFATFETKVKKQDGKDGYIDLIWKGVILIEMKSRGKNLDRAYVQARDYFPGLNDVDLPRYIMVCDFSRIRLYDLENEKEWEFPLKDLYKKVKLFGFLAGYQKTEFKEQDPVNIKAAEQMGELHDNLKENGFDGHDLELYLVRILFCMFADDTSLFDKNQFYDYLTASSEDGSDLAMRIAHLFDVLNTPLDKRIKTLSDELKAFPYVNGHLFEERIPIADFTSSMRNLLLGCCRLNWGLISPAIFGAMFQSVMDPDKRRSLGAHYTSEQNIQKVIRPLFLDSLWVEFESCKTNKKKLEQFHNKLASLRFLDPACGCGNFLIIAYRELRLLELETLKELYANNVADISIFIKVNVDQFYGIEYEEFPAQIARVAMWLIDHQMNMIVSEEFGQYFIRLPLSATANIINGNALQLDWEQIVPKTNQLYIMGNPPFVGNYLMSEGQKADMAAVIKDLGSVGQLDYVASWFVKAAQFIQGTSIRVGLVATNSICQGEQALTLWPYLMRKLNVNIFFAHQTFKWSNEAKGKAAVFCVIIGFSSVLETKKTLYTYIDFSGSPSSSSVKNINHYLMDAPTVFISKRSKPICDVQEMLYGTKPADGGNYLFTEEEMNAFIKEEPDAAKYFIPFIGAEDMIKGFRRYCLYLRHCPASELRKMPLIQERVKNVVTMRSESKKEATKKLAKYPTLLAEDRYSPAKIMIIPRHSSEMREYIPIGFYEPPAMCADSSFQIVNADLYTFGVFSSRMHMVWMRVVCGRLKGDYRYSNTLVYNNFPWPSPKEKQRIAIEMAAQEIIDIRNINSDSTLSDLYNPPMHIELRKAHEKLDKTVENGYGRKFDSDAQRVAFLFERYEELTKQGISTK